MTLVTLVRLLTRPHAVVKMQVKAVKTQPRDPREVVADPWNTMTT
ncbi:hypothetical protein [Synechococcus sp. H70.2]